MQQLASLAASHSGEGEAAVDSQTMGGWLSRGVEATSAAATPSHHKLASPEADRSELGTQAHLEGAPHAPSRAFSLLLPCVIAG